MSGDDHMNNLIKNELKNYFDTDSNNEYNLKIDTSYQKKVNTKDATGKPLEFRLELNTNVNINFDGENIEASFNESFNADIIDAFVLLNYLEENAERQYRAQLIGEPYSLSRDEIELCYKKLYNKSLFKRTWNHFSAKLDGTVLDV